MINVWGNVGNQAVALPMETAIPAAPTTSEQLLAWNPVTQAISYSPATVDPTSGDISTSGDWLMVTGKVLKSNGVQVVSARRTGWTAATGTPTRTAFDTATVTLPQLAERVKALLDDLIAHGLIGS